MANKCEVKSNLALAMFSGKTKYLMDNQNIASSKHISISQGKNCMTIICSGENHWCH